ncbi:MAG: phosphate propanoyltransferase [Pirellulales bacterium]
MSAEMVKPAFNNPSNSLSRDTVERIVREVVMGMAVGNSAIVEVNEELAEDLLVNVSARHIHLSDKHVEVLFGPGHTLTPMKWLYQDGYFAAEETLMVVGPRKRMLPSVRVLGPTRPDSQVELAYTDAVQLGLNIPVRHSGDVAGTPGCVLVGPHGAVNLDEGVIRAARHVHMNISDLDRFGVVNGDMMKLRITTDDCSMVFEDVKVRAAEGIKLEVHIDTDEGNACNITNASKLELLKADKCKCESH